MFNYRLINLGIFLLLGDMYYVINCMLESYYIILKEKGCFLGRILVR